MNFEIPVEIYLRLSGITRFMPDGIQPEEKELLTCVRLEKSNGKIFAIASNRKVAAIYMIGETTDENGAVHIVVDKNLIEQCEKEKAFNSKLFVTAVEQIGIVSLKTSLGYAFPGNGGFFSSATSLQRWRSWAYDKPITATKGAMYWTLDYMLALNSASPSGKIAFPEFIDADKPIVVRDTHFPDWVGLFMGNKLDDNNKVYTVEPATLPKWWNE